jgi:tRNA pseudouridine32 synthase/23S rRNA pseudouridine746 synthase
MILAVVLPMLLRRRRLRLQLLQVVLPLIPLLQVQVVSVSALEIPVLYESSRLLIINKPSGIGHHNDNPRGQDEDYDDDDDDDDMRSPGILTAVRRQLHLDEKRQRIWGVHRLDRVTTGILVFAKDAEMASVLSDAFRDKEIQKVYVGVSSQRPRKKKQGWVQGGMERSRNKSWKLVEAERHPNFAKTRFFTSRFQLTGNTVHASIACDGSVDCDSRSHNVSATAILFRPFTGKTHQLRVAAKAMGIPLFGDPVYKSSSTDSATTGSATFSLEALTDRRTVSSESFSSTKMTMLHASGIHIPKLVEDQDEVNVWSSPPFFASTPDIDEEEEHSRDKCDEFSSLSNNNDVVFQSCIHELMEKHCDVPGILEAMRSTSVQN